MSKRFCSSCGGEVKPTARYCPVCGNKLILTEKEVPKQKSDPVPKLRLAIIGLFVLIVGILVVIFVRYLTIEEHGVIAGQPTVGDGREYTDRTVEMTDIPSRIDDANLIFSLDDVLRYELIKVEYNGPTATIPVLAYISPKGRLVTALSISEPCNATRFTIIDNTIKCNNCPANWDLNTIQAYGCCPNNPPDPIPSRVIGNEVYVSIETLENWRRRL